MRLVNLNTAKTLQKLGYDGEAARWYARNGSIKSTNLVDDDIPAPRLDDAAYWIRDKHGVIAQVTYGYGNYYDPDEWFCILINQADCMSPYCKLECYPDYDTALEAAVTNAIEILKTKE